MSYNVPEEEKSTFNKKVKSSLELLSRDVGRTLGQLKVLKPETLVEAYNKPVQAPVTRDLTPLEQYVYEPQPVEEVADLTAPVAKESMVAPQEQPQVLSNFRNQAEAQFGGDMVSITPEQQATTDLIGAEVDSLRNDAGEIAKSPLEVFSKPLNANSVRALGLVDQDGNATERGQLFYNLQQSGVFNEDGTINEKGQAYLTPIDDMINPEWFNQPGNKEKFDLLWEDGVIRSSSTPGEIVSGVTKFIGDAAYGAAELTQQQAMGLAYNSRTWGGLLGMEDSRPDYLKARGDVTELSVAENMYKNVIQTSNLIDVGLAGDKQFIDESIMSPLYGALEKITGIQRPQPQEVDQANANIKNSKDALVAARYNQWATDQRLADMEAGQIAETIFGIDDSVKKAEAAKQKLGAEEFNKVYGRVGAFTNIAGDPTNAVPAAFAVKASRAVPLASRAMLNAQKTMGNIAAMDLAIAQGNTAVQASRAALAKAEPTVNLAQRMSVNFAEGAKTQPALLERSAKASQIAQRVTAEANQIKSTLPTITAELDNLIAKRNSLATRIPEEYSKKVLQTMELGRQVRSMPAKAVGATLERVGDTISKTDNAVTNFLQERGLDQMYTAAVGAAGVVGLAGSPVIGAIGAGAAALKTGKVLSNYGKLFRYVGKEMENVRGQIPFWKRVASHTAPGSLGRGIAHAFNMLDLGGVTSDTLRRTGRGIVAAAPTDLMFEYLSDGADMRPETLYQAAAESLVIGGSFAAAGGAFMGTKKRMRELSIGDELNFRRGLTDTRQKALFEAVPAGTRRAISTYAIANPTLNYIFKDSGSSRYDPNTNTAVINVNSTNPIKALVAHETLHHTIIKNNMENGISALFLGDTKNNTVGGLFRSRDGKLDPNFEAFKDAYYKRLGVDGMSNAERDAIYPLDKIAVEYFIEKHADQYAAMAESGELGAVAASGAARRKLGSILETVLPRIPVLKDLHFKSGGMIDANGAWVTGNGILDAEGVKRDPITSKMFRDMNRRSAGIVPGQFDPLMSDKPDSGAPIILNPADGIDAELLHPLVKVDDTGKPIMQDGKPVALDRATELERALAGLTAKEVLQRKRDENYAPEKGEAHIDDEGQFQPGWLSNDVLTEMFAKNKYNPEQKRIIREMNKLIRKGAGDRVVMINFPATTRNKAGKVVYKPQAATLRDTVPVAVTISKDGNLLFGLMSVTKLHENIQKRSQSKRGKKLYGGNVDLILRDTQAMMDYHKQGVDSLEYFSQKYGAVEADQRKKFINTMFGLLNQKEQAVLNPMLLEDGVKSRDNVYRTYRADRVSKAVPMSPDEYPAMPFSYEAVSAVRMPEQRQMPEGVDLSPEDLNPIANRQEAEGLFADGKRIFAFHEMDEKLFEITSLDVLKKYPPDSMGWMEPDTEPTGQMRFMPESEKATPAEVLQELDSTNFIPRKMAAKILGPFPEYLTPVADFIAKQREKLVSGTITPRDVWKAYAMTVASQGTGAVSVDLLRDKLAKVGIDFNPTDLFTDTGKSGQRTIRPEEAAAYWLGTPEGKRALDNAESGNTSPSDWDGLVQVRKAYGDDRFKTFNVFSDKNLSKIPVVVDQLNQSKGNSKKVLDAVQLLNGVSTGKKGFISHLLGLGNTPTIDAVEINFWLTGKGDVGTLKTKEADLARKIKDTFSDKRVREEMFNRVDNSINLLRDVAEGGKKVPKEVWSHVMHHWLWDKAKGLETTHAGMYEAQMRFMPDGDVGENSRYATPPSEETARDAISTSKRPFWGKHRNLEDGEKIGVRIDIPAFLSKGVYVQTVHEPATPGNVGDRIGYDTHVRLKNGIKFFVKEGSAESKLGAVAIKEGRANKHPIATVEGSYSKDRTIPKDINSWTAVGMNPDKHSYFYDKRTGEPVIGGEESYSVGNTVFVKNPVYGNKSDFRFMPEPLPANYQSSRDTTFLYQSIGPDGIVNLTRPIKSTEALPTVSTRHEYPVEDFTVSKFDKRASILYTTNKNGEPVMFKFDPQLMNKPEFADFDDLYDGAVVQLAMADRHGATDGDMGGHAFPDLKVNQDFIVDDGNGKKYKLVWSNNAWGPVKNMSTKAQKYGATTLLTYNMDPHAHDSNTRTVRIFSNEIANSGLSQVDQSTLLIVMNVALKKAQSSASKQDLRAFLKDKKDIVESLKKDDKIKAKSSSGNAGLSVAERDALLLSLDDIQKQIDDENKFLKESLGVKLAGDEEVKVDALFRNYQNKRRAYEKTPTSTAKKKAMVDAEKELKKYQKTKEFKKAEGLLPSRELDKFSNTFKGRKSLILAIKNKEASVKWHGFDSQKISQIIGDQLTGDSLHIVSSVELSQDPNFKAVYLGDDPREIARMSPQEKKAAQQLKSNPDFVPHEAYLWSMLGPAESKHTYNTNQRSVLESFPDFINEYSQLPVKPGKLKLNDPNSKASEFNIVNTIRDQSKIRIVFRAAKGRND